MDLKKKKFLVITDKGYMANGYEKEELVPLMLYAMIDAWNDDNPEREIKDPLAFGKKVVDMLFENSKEKSAIETLCALLLDDDDEDKEENDK